MLDDSYVGENTTVIDVGINVDENGKLCGDAAADTLEEKYWKAYTCSGRRRCSYYSCSCQTPGTGSSQKVNCRFITLS